MLRRAVWQRTRGRATRMEFFSTSHGSLHSISAWKVLINAVLLTAIGLSVAASLAQAQSTQSEVVVGKIDGIINPVMAGYVDRVISDAEQSNAAAVVFYMDTPGGLSDSMRDINQRIE